MARAPTTGAAFTVIEKQLCQWPSKDDLRRYKFQIISAVSKSEKQVGSSFSRHELWGLCSKNYQLFGKVVYDNLSEAKED